MTDADGSDWPPERSRRLPNRRRTGLARSGVPVAKTLAFPNLVFTQDIVQGTLHVIRRDGTEFMFTQTEIRELRAMLRAMGKDAGE